MLERDEVRIPNGYAFDREGYGTIHWNESEYSNGEWTHEFSVSGAAAAEKDSGSSTRQIYGQRYSADYSGGSLYVSDDPDDIGVYPENDGSDQLAPSWTVPLMEAAVGSMNIGADWFLAAGDAMREYLGPAEGYQLPNFEYTNTHDGILAWKECCHYGTFKIDTTEEKPTVTATTSFASGKTSGGYVSWSDTEFTAVLNDPYECPSRPCPTNDDSTGALGNPEEMTDSELETWGIKRVESGVTNDTEKDEVPEFIATKSPFKISNVEHTSEVVNKNGEKVSDEEAREIFKDTSWRTT